MFNVFNHWCFGKSSKSYLKNINPDSLRLKSINAYRATDKIEINGIMDLDEWAGSKVTSEFFQIDPKELSTPSEETTARVMYDDKNLYVFLEAFDSKPNLIKKTLARRDSWMDGFGNNSDWMGVTIDSKNDDYNGYFCGVNASGAIIDVALSCVCPLGFPLSFGGLRPKAAAVQYFRKR